MLHIYGMVILTVALGPGFVILYLGLADGAMIAIVTRNDSC